MATLILDTHTFITRLITAGMVEKQAEAIVDGLKEINLDYTATKEDILKLETKLTKQIAELKADIFKWLVPLLIGQIAVFATVVKLIGGG